MVFGLERGTHAYCLKSLEMSTAQYSQSVDHKLKLFLTLSAPTTPYDVLLNSPKLSP